MEINLKPNERLEDLQYNNLFIIQDKTGYCFTSDAIALANYISLKPKSTLVDLCSGSGVIGLLAHYKNKCSKTILVELQENLADMSKRTLVYNNTQGIEVKNQPLQGVWKSIGVGFDAVVCNPPYKQNGTAKKLNKNESIAIARHELTVNLEEIVEEASKLLKFGGDFYLVNKEERLVDMFVLLRKYNLEPKNMSILKSTKGANVVLIKSKKGGKSGITISLE